MDLLFKRYASPFIFLDGMILTIRFNEFVENFVTTINEENEEQATWEFYLNKVHEGSYAEFMEEMKTDKANQAMTANSIESTIQESLNILNSFNPERGE